MVRLIFGKKDFPHLLRRNGKNIAIALLAMASSTFVATIAAQSQQAQPESFDVVVNKPAVQTYATAQLR